MLAEEVTIRFATNDDAPMLTEHVHVSEAVVRRKAEHNEFVVAVSNSKVLGFLQLEYLWSKVPYIALIRVFAEYRRMGLGKRMLGFLEEFLRNSGQHALYSSSQADEPEPQDWHRHVGFKECGSIRGINDGIDEIFFCKDLSKQ